MSKPACGACGAPYGPDDGFCPSCGAHLGGGDVEVALGGVPAGEVDTGSPRRWRLVATALALVAGLAAASLLFTAGDSDSERAPSAADAVPTGGSDQPAPAFESPPGLRLAYGDRLTISIVDLDSESVTQVPVTSAPPELFPLPTMVPLPGALAYVDDGRARVVELDRPQQPLDLGPADAIAGWSGREVPAVWLIDLDLPSGERAPTVSAVDVAGRTVVDAIALPPGAVVGGGAADGLVIANAFADAVALVDEQGIRIVAEGRLVAVGEDWIDVWKCEDRLECGPRLIDPDGSAARSVVGQAPDAQVVSISPDRRWLAQLLAPRLRGSAGTLEVIDQETGGSRAVEVEVFGDARLAWSDDGSVLGWVSSRSLYLYRIDTGGLALRPETLLASSASPGEVVFLTP